MVKASNLSRPTPFCPVFVISLRFLLWELTREESEKNTVSQQLGATTTTADKSMETSGPPTPSPGGDGKTALLNEQEDRDPKWEDTDDDTVGLDVRAGTQNNEPIFNGDATTGLAEDHESELEGDRGSGTETGDKALGEKKADAAGGTAQPYRQP